MLLKLVGLKLLVKRGQNGYLWYLKAEGDTRARFTDYLEMAMLRSCKDCCYVYYWICADGELEVLLTLVLVVLVLKVCLLLSSLEVMLLLELLVLTLLLI
jgi:hypothetical protein